MVFGLDVFNTLESLFCTLILLLSTLDLIVKFCLIEPELLDCIVHLGHLPSLRVYYIADALLNIGLLRVRI